MYKGQYISTNIWQIIGTKRYNNTDDDDDGGDDDDDDDNNNNNISYILIFDAWHRQNSQHDKHLYAIQINLDG